MLNSRKISVAQFLKEYLETLTPGVIPRENFIDWAKIKAKCAEYADVIEYFESLAQTKPSALITELRDGLLSADEPVRILKGGFELLGHTGDYYVSDKDSLEIQSKAEEIDRGSEKAAAYCAQLLFDLGLKNLLSVRHVSSSFLGVQVGLESNRRKNVGGEVFNEWVRNLLESTCGLLGADFRVEPEVRISYKDSTTGKKVDFALLHKGKVKIGVEVNFYTTQGSKPTEITRAYENVKRELTKVGVELVWITDGAGYLKMKRSLGEAFKVQPNTYNFQMASRYLKQDILDLLG